MKQVKNTFVAATVICFALFSCLIFWSASADPAAQIILGLSPFFIHALCIALRLMTRFSDMGDLFFMWLTPIVFPMIFFFVWVSNVIPSISVMDGQSLAMWQVLLSFMASIIAALLLILVHSKPKNRSISTHKPVVHKEQVSTPALQQQASAHQTESQQHHHQVHADHLEHQMRQTAHYQQMASDYLDHNKAYAQKVAELEDELRITKQRLSISRDSVSVTLREIEAKAKALNFVVGRVYADKKGGSKEIREMLHIPRELYNEFSEITSDYSNEDAAELLNILLILQNRLAIYELPEKKVFSLETHPQIPLDRDPHGNDAIIAVLSKNDHDPVVDYYAGAKEVCEKLVAFLQAERSV